jgi:anti-sigma regulatory factor (Ser/Thr protein kinase)
VDEAASTAPLRLPRSLEAPELARRALTAAIDGHGISADSVAVEAALLVVSELVTNAILHAREPYELVIDLRGRAAVRISVADGSPDPPTSDPHRDAARPGGWGLRLIDRASDSWGVGRRGDYVPGKVVWAEIIL